MTDITIDVIDRGSFSADLNYMVEGAVMAANDDRNPTQEFIDFPVYNLVIDHPEATILWDTGIHHECADGAWPDWMYNAFPAPNAAEHRLDDDLAANGWRIDDIDYVFQSHLHVDHTGGLEFFADTDTPILVHEEELKYAYYSAVSNAGSVSYLLSDIHHDLNWQVLHGNSVQLFEDIEWLFTPGHSPGLLSTIVHLDDGHSIIFTSDESYTETNYVDEVPLGAGLLWNKQIWLENLHFLKDLERRYDAEVVFGHDPDQFAEIEDGWE